MGCLSCLTISGVGSVAQTPTCIIPTTWKRLPGMASIEDSCGRGHEFSNEARRFAFQRHSVNLLPGGETLLLYLQRASHVVRRATLNPITLNSKLRNEGFGSGNGMLAPGETGAVRGNPSSKEPLAINGCRDSG